ncbi:hypothetical protein [Noviherbaspirillum sedimenti]|uniref:Uncharacterized protein n=1 Tax=Noviherbaspirillum sedimenti TaxID=2320865 RepID=A0A3A3G4V4_9BURK|nr:hypothetical protein [Noviherbaspirillum sedimenti]RJG02705.1 hypothetical protein D3878_14895 [Noviherbaspirillum sedimenti]
MGNVTCGAILRAPAGTITTADPPLDAPGDSDLRTGGAEAGGVISTGGGCGSCEEGTGATAWAGGATAGGGSVAAGGVADMGGVGAGAPLAGFAPPGKAPPPDRCAMPGADAAGIGSWLACASMIGARVDADIGASVSASADCAR